MGKFMSKVLLLVIVLIMPTALIAQDTSSSMRGRVFDATGAPAAGAMVVVEDLRTGNQRRLQTNASGTFLATSLAVGGPYRVTVNDGQTFDVASISLGEIYNLTINLQADMPVMEEVITFGQMAEVANIAPGPSVSFSEYDLDKSVAFNRDIKDVYTIDPRLNLDGFQINCAGKHPRFNNITLDGVSHSDRFGLNTNGYSTATGMPFPYDAIRQVSVELAPFDVSYGGFSACNINAVTKSGSNEWVANVFYEYTTDDLINDELDGQDLSSSNSYTEYKQGASLGGPIFKDKLFFFIAYEESDEPRFLAHGYAGSGNGVERPWLSQSDYQRVVDIAQNIYGYDTGGMGQNGAQTTENFFARIDWNINDSHNLAIIYNDYEGVQSRSSDSDPYEFEFANHFYDKGSISESTTAIFDSQWTDALSTQFYFTDSRMDDSQVTVGPKYMGDHQINMNGFSNVIYLGADDSRQANSLYTDSQLLKLSAQYLAGDHVITAGYEREELEVFNIFVPHSRGGEWDYRDDSFGNNDPACAALTAQQRYDNTVVIGAGGDEFTCKPDGIDHFELGRPYRVYYGSGGGTNNPIDGAAQFTNIQNAIYIQDEMYFADRDLTVVAGLRYEWLESDDTPRYNSSLSEAIGVRNDSGIDGTDLLMPRLGFTWGWRDDVTLRGGIGLYSGGNPNVWLGNAWSRDGITVVQLQNRYYHDESIFGDIELVSGAPIGGAVPQEMYDEIAAISGDEGSIYYNNLIDPDYEAPSEWKFALGATWDMPWGGITADFDYMYTKLQDGVMYVDMSQEQTGETLAGAPIYTAIAGAGEGNLMLTNSNVDAESHIYSVVFKKDFDWGLGLMLGYAYTDSEDVSPMTSFTGSSSFNNLATNDINNPPAAPSNYRIQNRLTLQASYAKEFWGDNTTRFTLVGIYSDGQAGSYTMTSEDAMQVGFSSRHLLYIPTGLGDPNVVFSENFLANDATDFLKWIKGKKSGFVRRNSVSSHDSARLDLRIDQEIPLFVDGLKARAFMKIYNFTNLLNDDWGRQYDAEFSSVSIISLDEDNPLINGAYHFDSFNDASVTDLQEFSSLWQIRLGIEINFR